MKRHTRLDQRTGPCIPWHGKNVFLHFVPRRIFLHCWLPEEERYVSWGREHARPGAGRFHLRKKAVFWSRRKGTFHPNRMKNIPTILRVLSANSMLQRCPTYLKWFCTESRMAETTILLVDSRQTRLKVAIKLALTNLSGIIGLHSGKGIHY